MQIDAQRVAAFADPADREPGGRRAAQHGFLHPLRGDGQGTIEARRIADCGVPRANRFWEFAQTLE